MPVSIRSRLLLLVLSVLLPAIAVSVWVIIQTYHAERQANERVLRETSRALSLVVDQELAERAMLAQMLALSPVFDNAPDLTPENLTAFEEQAKRATRNMQGWVKIITAKKQLLDTRVAPDNEPLYRVSREPQALVDVPFIGALNAKPGGEEAHVAVVQPILRNGKTLLNLTVTMLPQELQTIINAQQLPKDWIGTVLDKQATVVARYPGGLSFMGRPATQDLKERLKKEKEGQFHSVSLEGVAVTGYFSTSPQGWTYVIAMPTPQFAGGVPKTVLPVALAVLALLALAIGGAVWVANGIARSVISLKRTAARMQAGREVEIRRTGIAECDEVAQALAAVGTSISQSRSELEAKVTEAVELTRQAEQRVSQSQRVEALGRLTGGVAHDFNNLLGVISNSAHLISRMAPNEEVQVPVAAMLRAVEVGSRLTQHLLRFAGRQSVRPQVMTLRPYLPEIQKLMETVLGKQIATSVSVAPDTHNIKVDTGELELSLINLALNARDAMPSGGQVWIQARNAEPEETTDLPGDQYVLITVSDNGTGIEHTLSERVFEPFFTTKEVGKGTGLGLSQVHGFCVQAGGTARLASTPGLGTTVSLLLPAFEGEMLVAPKVQPMRNDRLQGIRILLVEDNEELGDVTAALLESYGVSLLRANRADEALAICESKPNIDVLLSDVVMPGPMDGVALALTLRQRWPQLPVVLITGYSTALGAASDFTVLRKPCAPDTLVAALTKAIDEMQAATASLTRF